MDDILKAIYYGELRPIDHIMPKGRDYEKVYEDIQRERDYFHGFLGEEDQRRFDRVFDLQYRMESLEYYEHFAYGVRLGLGLMAGACCQAPVHPN